MDGSRMLFLYEKMDNGIAMVPLRILPVSNLAKSNIRYSNFQAAFITMGLT